MMLEPGDGDWNSQFPIVHLHHTPSPQTQGFVEEEAGRAKEAKDEHKELASSRQMCRAAAHMNS